METSTPIEGLALPIYTLVDGKPIPGALELIKAFRGEIFCHEENVKEFAMVNSKNKKFTSLYKFVRCLPLVALKLQHLGMIDNAPILDEIRADGSKYQLNLIVKKANNGRNWLMLHISR